MSVERSALSVERSAPRGAVFLSYASQDAVAAQRICEALRAAGVEVWFDQNELVGGDAWDAKIRKQIKECALFVPVISTNTNARLEGYFRREWKLAVERTHDMADEKTFLMPVVIDATTDAGAFVPEKFREVQWTRIGSADSLHAFCEGVKKLLGGFELEAGRPLGSVGLAKEARPAQRDGPPSPDGFGGPRGVASPVRAGKVGRALRARLAWSLGAIGVASLAAVIGWKLLHPGADSAAQGSVTSTAEKTAAPLSGARKLVVQARALFEEGDYANHENFFLADDLLKRALALDGTDGELWAAQAQLSREMLMLGYDRTSARADGLRMQAQRAIKLLPESVEAQIAYAGYLQNTGGSAAHESIRLMQQLSGRAPTNRRIFRVLGMAYGMVNNLDEAVAAFDRAHALPGGDAVALAMKAAQLIWYGRYEEAETTVAQAQALRTTGRGLVLDVMLKLCWRGDLDGAETALERWPAWLRLEDRGVFFASQVWL